MHIRSVTRILKKSGQKYSARLNQSEVEFAAGNFGNAEEIAQSILSVRAASKESKYLAELLLIKIQSRQGHFSGLIDRLQALDRKVSPRRFHIKARIANEIIWICHRSGNLALGVTKGEEYLAANAIHWPELEVIEILCQLSSCHFHRGDSARAEELVKRALQMAEESKSPKALTQSYWQIAALSAHNGETKLAEEQISEARKWAKISELQHIEPILNNNAAAIMLEKPDPDFELIEQLAESAYLELTTKNLPAIAAYTGIVLSEIGLRQGDFDSAIRSANRALSDLPAEVPAPRSALTVQLAKIYARMGDYDDAARLIATSVAAMDSLEPSRELARRWGDIARVYVEIGLTDRGVYAYEKAMQMSGLLREEQENYVN